jgi:hypothetical protein
MMGTRCGDLDPAVPLYLQQQMGMSAAEVDTLLNKRSGVLGVAGVADMRALDARRAQGDSRCASQHAQSCDSGQRGGVAAAADMPALYARRAQGDARCGPSRSCSRGTVP